jgi:hypothetical protein
LCQSGETIGKQGQGPIVEHSSAVVPEQHRARSWIVDPRREMSSKLL